MFFAKKSGQMTALKLDTNEAYTLWRAYNDLNLTIGHMNLVKNLTYDADFVVYLDGIIKDLRKQYHAIERFLQKYSIAGPDPAVVNQKTAGNAEIVDDENVAEVLYRFMRLDVNLLALSLKYPFTNDDIRSFMVGLTKSALGRIDSLIKYMKLKNWLYEPPLYPYLPPDNHEQVATNEIALLWEYLIFKYHSLRQFQNYSTYSSDPDFVALLNKDIILMREDINMLESKLVYYGVSLPKHHSNITVHVEDKTLLNDRYMLGNMQRVAGNAIVLHASLIPEIIVNDKLRKFLIDLSLNDIDKLDKLSKFGKAKGWEFITPLLRG